MITNRLKELMPQLVGLNQSSFFSGRQITDNIIIYQEALKVMRNKKCRKGIMALKIDLEKAYDRLSWEFIRDTFYEVGFNEIWIMNIMACITSTRMAILWEGDKLEWFNPSRGIRQGDSISPFIYLFIYFLCMERLSQLIHKSISRGKWKPISVACNGQLISHLFFCR